MVIASPSRTRRTGSAALLVTGFVAVALAVAFGADLPLIGPFKDFSVPPEYYDPPNQSQRKSRLSGGQAEFPDTTQVLLTKGIRLEAYEVTGQTNSVIEAVSCLYDRKLQIASSPDPVKGRFGSSSGTVYIEGASGFSWHQTNNAFVVSNKVYTLIRRAPAEANPSQQ